MKRLRRIIFNGLTVLSLLLCVATVGLWVRSYTAPECIRYCATDVGHSKWTPIPWVSYWWISAGGTCGMHVSRGFGIVTPGFGEPWFKTRNLTVQDGPTLWSRVGWPTAGLLREPDKDGSSGNRTVHVASPYWFLALLSSALPALRVRRTLVRRSMSRSRAGLCQSCHYNLTANVSGVCPECGKAIVRAG